MSSTTQTHTQFEHSLVAACARQRRSLDIDVFGFLLGRLGAITFKDRKNHDLNLLSVYEAAQFLNTTGQYLTDSRLTNIQYGTNFF